MDDALKFKKFNGTVIDDVHLYVKKWCDDNPYGTVIVGCDSQEYTKFVKYAVTILMHYVDENGVGHGGHVIYSTVTNTDRNMKHDVYTKLWGECELSVKAAMQLGDVGRKVRIHLDYNSDGSRYSNVLYSAGIGFVNGMGFDALGKPFSLSCHTADRIVKNKVKR